MPIRLFDLADFPSIEELEADPDVLLTGRLKPAWVASASLLSACVDEGEERETPSSQWVVSFQPRSAPAETVVLGWWDFAWLAAVTMSGATVYTAPTGGKKYVRLKAWNDQRIMPPAARFLLDASRGEIVHYKDANPLNLRRDNLEKIGGPGRQGARMIVTDALRRRVELRFEEYEARCKQLEAKARSAASEYLAAIAAAREQRQAA